MKQLEPVDLICPTYNNTNLLGQCVSSINSLILSYPHRILVVNNGHPSSCNFLRNTPHVKVIQTGGQNLGWEGGLVKGLEHSTSEFVGFINDDIYVPPAQFQWMRTLISTFNNKEVAAVGPSSNFVMGPQNIWKIMPHMMIEVTFLIGFCIIMRRQMLDEVGGVDASLPGGDDLDLSIRFRSKGYKLVARRDVFVYHHGAVTGSALYGSPNKMGGWNSVEMTEETDHALIRKHGFKKWFQCRAGLEYPGLRKGVDDEGRIVREMVKEGATLDLGCANNKSIPSAIGVDIIKRGDSIPNLNAISEADIQADCMKELPFPDESQDNIIARHLLEHSIDVVQTLNNWKKKLKPDGRLIIAVPNEEELKTIPLNPEHVHAFTPNSLLSICSLVGLHPVKAEKSDSQSFVVLLTKNGAQN